MWKDVGGTDPTHQVTESGYDNVGNLKTVKDALNRVTTNFYDALNRFTRLEDPVNGSTKPTLYEYNGQDSLTKVTDAKNLSTTYTYNGHGDLTQQVSPDTGTTTFTYDLAGNMLTKLDARGVTATYTYDALNRVSTISYPAVGTDPAEVVTYTYDTCTNGKGHLCSLVDKTGTTTWSYNVKGRVTAKSQTDGALTKTITYGYNSAGQLNQITTPSGQVVVYTYQNNQPVSVTVNSQSLLSNVAYEPFGPNGGWKWGNSTVGTPNFHLRMFDKDYRATEISTDEPTQENPNLNGPPLSKIKRSLTWDYVSRIATMNDPNTLTYSYDDLDRLTGTQIVLNDSCQTPPCSLPAFISQGYDEVGNRLTYFDNYVLPTTYVYGSTNHRLQTRTDISGTNTYSSHDNAGNLTQESTQGLIKTWSYGGNSRPYKVVVNSTTTNFATNALGQRVKKSTGAQTTRFVYDEQGRLQGEYDASGTLVQETVWLENLPVATLRPSGSTVEIYYVHPDNLGTPRAVTRASDNQLVWKWDNIEPFGNNGDDGYVGGGSYFAYNLRFPGQYFDEETGMHYNYFRDYDPSIGRYLQSDPVGLLGGLSTYGYVLANPMKNVDPFGLFGCPPGTRAVPLKGSEDQYPKIALCEPQPGLDQNEKRCPMAECAAGMPPAKWETRSAQEIDGSICERICGILWPGPPLPYPKPGQFILGQATGYFACQTICGTEKKCGPQAPDWAKPYANQPLQFPAVRR